MLSALLLVAPLACDGPRRELAIVAALPSGCVTARINEVRLIALGDFPPEPALTASTAPTGQTLLGLPGATREVVVEARGPEGLVGFGRSGSLELGKVEGESLSIAFGPPEGLCATARMSYARAGHRATLLDSGAVLISGGVDSDGFAVPRLERYLPSGDREDPAARFQIVDQGGSTALDPRAALGHSATVLSSGEVLIAGGAPAQRGRAHGIAFEGSSRHLPDGRSVELARLLGGGPRAFHSATRLGDGRILLAGGCAELEDGACAPGRILGSTVLYDEGTERYEAGPALLAPRWAHDAVLLGDGAVLLVGGQGEPGTLDPGLEVYDPGEPRGYLAGKGAGRAARMGAGAVLITGGGRIPSEDASWWIRGEDPPLVLADLPGPRRGHSATPLEDGAVLLAGGSDGSGVAPPLVLVDGKGDARPLELFSRSDHSATRLGDGTVLLAGGRDGGGATTEAALFFGSPLGPWSNPSIQGFDSPSAGILPDRPDRARIVGGALQLSVSGPGQGGRPGTLAILAAARVADFELSLLLGREGAGAAALVLGHASEAEYHYLVLEPGRAVSLFALTPGQVGQAVVSPIAGCRGELLSEAELPDGALAPLSLRYREGELRVAVAEHDLLRCTPPVRLPRGAVGLGAMRGTIRCDNLELSR